MKPDDGERNVVVRRLGQQADEKLVGHLLQPRSGADQLSQIRTKSGYAFVQQLATSLTSPSFTL
ncbi:hypothetical protein [Nocardioides lianchengensis]|uniref:hypothetical protein n=1 Tax=Nocardioides lianchengensis TaxID=1045774 RepID=UPI000B851F6C|nr:hypothetical protein [Nocardioides lianchengensis]NYG09013.1 3-polyprenyl-4-hydroxybenzoate decarboxylase [Nocardioides lianchengensis]